jgi:hypothetical protein
MKRTKINQRINVIIMALVTGATMSCSDFLDQVPKTSLSKEQVFSDLKNIEPAVDGLYTAYRGTKEGREGLTFMMLGLDETKQGIVQMDDAAQSGMDYYNGLLEPTSPQIDKIWSKKWPVVVSAAEAIDALDNAANAADDEATLKTIAVLKGEASFIRALVMIELAMYWGEVPVIDIANMVNTARQPLNAVWEQIFSDFKYAAENLPDTQTEKKRATSGAAWAMLGKAYMSVQPETGLRNFDEARKCFEEVTKKGLYRLDDRYSNLFEESMEFNSPESIVELDFENPWPFQNYWEFDLGSRTVDNAFGNGCYFSGYDVALPTEYAYKMKSEGGVWEDGDLRKEEAIRYDFTYMGITLTQVSWGADELDPHIKKYEDERTDMLNGSYGNMWYSGKNFILLRYADVLLCYAECLNELGQTAEAVNIVNEVRSRAWGGSLPADKQWQNMSKDEFQAQVMDERIRELCFEGWRRMDLIRTGKLVELVKERNPWAKQSGTMQDYHNRWPIPDNEIKNNPDIEVEDQNPGYNK